MNKDINDITYLENCETVPVVRFHPFDGIEWLNCGFSTRTGGVSGGCHSSLNLGFERGDRQENVIANFRLFSDSAGFDVEKICLPSQWHTNNIRIADICDMGWEKPEEPVDGQITDKKGPVLIAYGADCSPVFLADKAHRAIGLVHSGWKGTLNSIVCDALRMMSENYGTKPEDIIAVIGPSISMDSYEVGPDVAEHFIGKYRIDVRDDSPIIKNGIREGKYQLDLWEAIRTDLLAYRIKDINIHKSGLCTFKEKDLFYSHRRDGNARGVMAAFMSII
ncbi:MAG: peptidoglycan editing factor PgeF [Lachnospiraceae bacterium]|nr:peptidoglycan editing factor PgeF [Lachnospiraceae bacterium]